MSNTSQVKQQVCGKRGCGEKGTQIRNTKFNIFTVKSKDGEKKHLPFNLNFEAFLHKAAIFNPFSKPDSLLFGVKELLEPILILSGKSGTVLDWGTPVHAGQHRDKKPKTPLNFILKFKSQRFED